MLVVDDESGIRSTLGEYLTELGYEVVFAETAIGALGMVRSYRPDAVLLDLTMPGAVGGESVVEPIAREAPVIVVTAVHDLEVARNTLRAGAFDFVMKPFSLKHIGELVEAAVAFGRGGGRGPRPG